MEAYTCVFYQFIRPNRSMGSVSIVLEIPESSVSEGWAFCDASMAGGGFFGVVSCQREHPDERLFGGHTGSDRPDDGRLHSSVCDAISTLFHS